MGARNGYFQLCMKEDGTYIRLFPQMDGGEPISLEELRNYLALKNYVPDAIALNNALSSLSKPTDVKINDNVGYAEAEMFTLTVTPDRMMAIARFYPCSNAGAALTKEEILNDLKHKGIQVGIDENVISKYLSDKHYCTNYVIAKGISPRHGTDASIHYLFNTNPNTKPTLNSDGTVDFFHLNIICKCMAGQVLAELTKEDPGEAGRNVLGERVAPRDVKRLSLKYGRNITLSEDGLSISSQIDGHVSLVEDKVIVTDVYEVTDVDTSTGNIDYKGNVLVLGNVKAGFCVSAEGNIEVRGVVEGALLDANGDIIITRGMNGMGRGKLNAGGNVVAKFIENATVSAGGYVHAEAILHSQVSAKGDVEVSGKKGFITGGMIRSLGTVSARMLGSTMGADTEVEVGIDPGVKARLNKLQQSIASAKKNVAQIEPVLITLMQKKKRGDTLTMQQMQYYKQLSTEYAELKPQLEKDIAELETLSGSMDEAVTEAIVKVSEFAYPGTKITISDISLYINTPTQHCRFVKEGADIRVKPL